LRLSLLQQPLGRANYLSLMLPRAILQHREAVQRHRSDNDCPYR
jgi:hypothetical protein